MAQQLGIRRLYYFLFVTAVAPQGRHLLIDSLGLGIEARYLYGSRQAWASAAFGPGRAEPDRLFSFQSTTSTSFLSKSVLDRAGLSAESISERLGASGFSDEESRTTNLNASERTVIRNMVESDEDVLALIAARSLEEEASHLEVP